MVKTVGNYLNQPNKDFPLDCETLDALQSNIDLVSIIGNMAGDKAILRGCELSQDGTSRAAGYVFARTAAYPDGEVLYFEGGVVAGGMYIKLEDVAVTAQGYDYPKAYTKRSLAPGVGKENFSWTDFKTVLTTDELNTIIVNMKKTYDGEIARLSPPPLGIIQMWAGQNVPEGYALCDGAQYSMADYPDLYKSLSGTFNAAISSTGTAYTTTAGYFRVPDLRGRFVVGRSDNDNEYSRNGMAGGEKKHLLTTDEMPKHTHQFWGTDKDWGTVPAAVGIAQDQKVGDNGADGGDNRTYTYKTSNAGGDAPHENRPPYYVLAYIMRLK